MNIEELQNKLDTEDLGWCEQEIITNQIARLKSKTTYEKSHRKNYIKLAAVLAIAAIIFYILNYYHASSHNDKKGNTVRYR